MDGDGSPTPGSDANQTPPGTGGDGGAGDGSDGGAAPAADAFAAERDRLTAQVRDFQSQKDKLAQKVDDLTRQLASGNGGTPEPATSPPAPLTADGVMALLRREREMTAAVDQLRSEFPFADDAIFKGYDRYDSVEAFHAAAQGSHAKITSLAEKAAQPLIDAALKPYIEKYGQLSATPAAAGTAPAGGLPTIEQLRSFSLDQLDALAKQHGDDVVDRIIRSSTV